MTERQQLTDALSATVDLFGGLDILVLNAGIFPSAVPVSELDLDRWQKVMRVNLDSRTPDMVRRFTQSQQAANTDALAGPDCIAAGQRLAG